MIRAEEGIIYIVNAIPNPTQITLPNIEKQVIGENSDVDSAGGSDKAETNNSTGAVSQTGDQTKYGRYLWLLLVSVVTIGVVVYQQNKREEK